VLLHKPETGVIRREEKKRRRGRKERRGIRSRDGFSSLLPSFGLSASRLIFAEYYSLMTAERYGLEFVGFGA